MKNKPAVSAIVALVLLLMLTAGAGAEERLRVVLLGDSLTRGGDWTRLLPEVETFNHGVSGDTTSMILARLEPVIEVKPELIFLQGGINDFGRYGPRRYEVVLKNHLAIWRRLQENLPETRLFIVSLLPVSERRYPGWNRAITAFNRELRLQAEKVGLTFIDLQPLLAETDGGLRPDFTFDGLHLKKEAYLLWAEALKPHLAAVRTNHDLTDEQK